MIILSIETSCDETAAAITKGDAADFELLSNVVSSQVKLHAEWGGVVPNLAAREHLKNIMPVIEQALQEAQVTKEDVDLIAVTNGPGLIPALLIGVMAAKTLSYLWKVPLLGVNHIEGHIYANFIPSKRNEVSAIFNFQFSIFNKIKNSNDPMTKTANDLAVAFPALCLVVSGGHTQLVLMKKHLDYEIVGETQDDAAGEAFDKVARILDLGYPGGPAVAERAEHYKKIPNTKYQLLDAPLPRPMINSGDFNFSFSGLKTAVLYKFRALQKDLSPTEKELLVTELATEFQEAAVDVLVAKTISAAKKYEAKTILLAGGVSANLELRKQLLATIKKDLPDVSCVIPELSYTGDNAAMIGAVAHFRWEKMSEEERKKLNANWQNLEANANLKITFS